MKKRNALILLFMVTLAIGSLLNQAPALATMSRCSDVEMGDGRCFEITSGGYAIYVIRAVNSNGVYPVTLNDDWPYKDPASGRMVFSYKAGTTDDALLAVKNKLILKPSAWSYIMFSLSGLPLDANPPGAQLPLEQLHSSCETPELGSRIAYKLNPSVNFTSKDTQLALFADSGTTYDSCGAVWVVYSNSCASGSLLVPKIGEEAPVERFRTFYCEDSRVEVKVEYDLCTSAVIEVQCNQGVVQAVRNQTWGYAEVPGCPDINGLETRTFQILNMGPSQGVTICTGTDELPVFLWGNRAYWCGTAPTGSTQTP
jgi:hypothetical protein